MHPFPLNRRKFLTLSGAGALGALVPTFARACPNLDAPDPMKLQQDAATAVNAFAVDLKELKYFSNRFELEDLRNYLTHFHNGAEKIKGEASPSYSMLPTSTIRLIRALVPDLKLIYLMREPISRAWSHARHNCREHESTFKGYTGRFEDVSEEKWIECDQDLLRVECAIETVAPISEFTSKRDRRREKVEPTRLHAVNARSWGEACPVL